VIRESLRDTVQVFGGGLAAGHRRDQNRRAHAIRDE
jgi:hypothetical protein